jgi:hypothetical protein
MGISGGLGEYGMYLTGREYIRPTLWQLPNNFGNNGTSREYESHQEVI